MKYTVFFLCLGIIVQASSGAVIQFNTSNVQCVGDAIFGQNGCNFTDPTIWEGGRIPSIYDVAVVNWTSTDGLIRLAIAENWVVSAVQLIFGYLDIQNGTFTVGLDLNATNSKVHVWSDATLQVGNMINIDTAWLGISASLILAGEVNATDIVVHGPESEMNVYGNSVVNSNIAFGTQTTLGVDQGSMLNMTGNFTMICAQLLLDDVRNGANANLPVRVAVNGVADIPFCTQVSITLANDYLVGYKTFLNRFFYANYYQSYPSSASTMTNSVTMPITLSGNYLYIEYTPTSQPTPWQWWEFLLVIGGGILVGILIIYFVRRYKDSKKDDYSPIK